MVDFSKKYKGDITVLGAGLVGTLTAIYMARKGFQVSLFEQRGDIRKIKLKEGRSINLAVSNRGWKAMEVLGIADLVREHVVPMHGRMMHNIQGELSFQGYGQEGQSIYSVSRGRLNQLLLDIAEESGVQLFFGHKCTYVDLKHGITYFTVIAEELSEVQADSDLIIGADGAFSAVRKAMQRTDRYNFSQFYLEWGYKELTIPAKADGSWALDPNALHIWPRGQFMLIALPNLNQSFTCTLFLPFEGPHSFKSLQTDEQIQAFFREQFPDATPLMPQLLEEYHENPESSLVTISCFPWTRHSRAMLIGDACHAMVPFYGQGMNAGFEDVRIFTELLDTYDAQWEKVLHAYEQLRKPDNDAIAELAMANFIEMRDLVADPKFLLRKKIEARLHELYPNRWLPLYTMVTFSDMRYSEAQNRGRQQTRIMEEVMKQPGIEKKWESLNFKEIVDRLEEATEDKKG